MTRVSTLQLNTLTLGSALGVQSQYAQAETQQASGLVASDFATMGGANSSEMLNLEDGIAQSQTWASNATTVGSRTQGMYTSLGNMVTTVTSLESTISGAGSTSDNSTLLAAVQELQKTLATEMNAQQAGSYLFAGSNVGQAPVDLTAYPSSTFSVSSPDTSYYTGDNNVLSVRISQQQTVNYNAGATANQPAFEEALRATQAVIDVASSTLATSTATAPTLAAAQTGSTGVAGGDTFTINGLSVTISTAGESLSAVANDINSAAAAAGSSISAKVVASGNSFALQVSSGSTADLTFADVSGTSAATLGLSNTTYSTSLQTGLKAALGVATSAVTGLANLQESVAAISSELSDAHDQQNTYVTYLQTSLSGVKDVDTAQVAAKVSQYQTQLQASYLAVAQISKVNLAQYL